MIDQLDPSIDAMHSDGFNLQLATVYTYLGQWLEAPIRPDTSALTYVSLAQHHLFPTVISEIANAVDLPEPVTALFTGIALLAPEQERNHDLLKELIVQSTVLRCDQFVDRCYELVLTWGCGCRFASAATFPPWETAVIALESLCEPLVEKALWQLAALHFPPPAGDKIRRLASDHAKGKQSYGSSLALEPVALDKLRTWKLDQYSLRSHLLLQIGGQPGGISVRSGSFSSSVLYPLLRDEIGIRDGTVGFFVCHSPECNGAQVAEAIALACPPKIIDLQRHGLFEGNHCRYCGRVSDPEQTYRLARRHWLIVPAAYGGAYEQRQFFRCTSCGHHFLCSESYTNLNNIIDEFKKVTDEGQLQQHKVFKKAKIELARMRSEEKCPICSCTSISQRLVHLWVYNPGSRLTRHMET